jgi:GPH family glycoside/pentoside/hexuronide:cation symporter
VSAILLLTPTALRERVEYQGRGGGNPYATLRDVLRNHHARILLTVWFAEGLGGGVLGVLAPFVTEYILKRPDLIAVVPAFFVLANIASIPLWIMLSRRFGKRNVWRVAFAGQATFFGATFFVTEGQLTLLAVLLIGAGMSSGCGGVIGTSMLADSIDYDELESGERKEGAYSAAWGFALKSAIGIVIVLTGVVLQASGFQPNVEQSYGAALALRSLFAGAPFLASLMALFLLRRFSLDAAEHARIRAALDERAINSR